MGPPLEAFDDVGEAGASFRQVRRIDLSDVAEADDLRAGTSTRDERFHLFGREILRFVNDDEFLQEGSPAHEAHGLDADAALDEVERSLPAPFAA